ncbi:hypothetical protein [Ruegeria atlantica]|uniref:hypothetical protein n=1 Tax=Ruegeria atlantica TaxID=81569 RepID=UPI002493E3D9|nr:hypothetical protein [Ruegeria atlantica]
MSEHSVIDYSDIRSSVTEGLGSDSLGWIEIVTQCFEDIKTRCDEEDHDYPLVLQIKEKFGELRIYLHQSKAGRPEFVGTYLETARQMANRSCEMCGNSCRQQWIGNWMRNLCAFCAHEDAKRQKLKLHKQPLNKAIDHRLKCSTCGYIGQIVPGGSECVACVIETSDN